MKYVGIVFVRLNSKRVPYKSIRTINSRSLIDYTIETLTKVNEISETYLYCSQDKIRNYINPKWNYKFIKRSVEIDYDYITFNDVLESIVDRIKTDYFVFLCCTSPFITSKTIKNMISCIDDGNADSAFTAFEINNFCWFDGKPLNYELSDVPRTQDLKPIIRETSGLYIFSKKLFKDYKRRIGFNPHVKIINQFEGFDIDTMDDLKFAKLIGERYYHG